MAYTGLINFHYAILESDNESGTIYGTPKRLGAAISLTETPTTNTGTLYAENGPSETASSNGPTTAEIATKDLSQEVRADLLGQKIDENGVLKQNREDKAPYVAFGFQMTGEAENDAFVWLYKGKFSRPNTTGTTKGESIEFATPSITATFIGRDSDGEEKASVIQNEENSAVTASWFDSVYEGTPTV
ncbi:phage tail protein [Jeotgalibacillus sp. S-D1]|uniref:major tail protein n=1 Tax=Jeotgalibacillus sp. S-D1 TaxID=2552189 RepID=UPI0010596C07|nr:major tail protein [Jeotgalibacillus sp. S-D1]TDL34578.1 phage tail protein [Jeotgalibacillus sp. S-D1]